MTESLGQYLVSALASVTTLNLSQAHTDSYPYAIYEISAEPVMDKAGAAAYLGDASIRIYDKTFSTADSKSTNIKSILAQTIGSDSFIAIFQRESKSMVEDVFCIELSYRLIQLKDITTNNI